MSETVPFEKFDGAGNDFVVVDIDQSPDGWSADRNTAAGGAERAGPERAAFARAHCDRETGVADSETPRAGADGVLFLALSTAPGAASEPATVTMTLVQPDGSIAEMCGNGARCVAAWAADRADATEFDIKTPAGTRRAVVEGGTVAVEMGEPRLGPEAVPLAGEAPLVNAKLPELDGTPAADVAVTAVNTGVPHAVVFVEDVAAVDIDAVAPPIRHAESFPEGANVTFASRDGAGFSQRTFERGVEGETQACGTGAVAVAAAAKRLGRLPEEMTSEEWIRVSPPGGDLAVTVSEEGPARLRGPAVKQFEGELPAEPAAGRIAGTDDDDDGHDSDENTALDPSDSGGKA